LRKGHTTLTWTVVALLVPALAVAGCGKSKKKSTAATASTLNVTIAESGKTAKYTVPTTVTGGLVRMVLTNQGKMPHSGQLVRIEGNHTPQEALKVIGGNNTKTPSWIRGEGGVGSANPGQSGTATMNLPAGKYFVADVGNGGNGPPAYAPFTVTSGKAGSLPSTSTTLTAANPGKDKYKWQLSGSLKPGANSLTFDSKGKNTIHLAVGFRLKGPASKAQIIKFLKSNSNATPSFADQRSFVSTGAIDSGKSFAPSFDLTKPGKYVLFCPLHDRDGGKAHFEEGLLTTITVK
jgi:hypothetical protein